MCLGWVWLYCHTQQLPRYWFKKPMGEFYSTQQHYFKRGAFYDIFVAHARLSKRGGHLFKKNHKNRHMLYNWTNTTTHLTTYSTRMWYVGIEMSEFMHLTIKSLRWQAIQMRINSSLQFYTVHSVGIFIICWFERSRRNTFILVLVRELFYLFPPSTITIVDVVSAGTTNQNNTNKSKVLNLLTWMSVLM